MFKMILEDEYESLSELDLISVNGGNNGGGCTGGGAGKVAKGDTGSGSGGENPTAPTNTPSGGGGGGSTSTSSGGCIAPVYTDTETKTTETEDKSNDSSGGDNNVQETTTPSSIEQVEKAIADIGHKDYIKGKDGYMCDDYVFDVIKKAGYDASDYYVDNPSGKTVDTHISELTKPGNTYQTDASKLEVGAYVVFMSDKQKSIDSHAAILVVEEGGSYMMDNSSRNNLIVDSSSGEPILNSKGDKQYKGGTECYGKGKQFSAQQVCNAYSGYENFYFQKL